MTFLNREDISNWQTLLDEPSGARPNKYWLSDEDGKKWLFKPARHHANGTVALDDFSEVITTQVALKLNVPAAITRLAVHDGINGAISQSVTPNKYSFMEAGHWLGIKYPDRFASLVRSSSASTRANSRGYTYSNLHEVLRPLQSPLGWQGVEENIDAYTIFCGFLLLDALVANTDRHAWNWGIYYSTVMHENDIFRIAPSYDHGAALGPQLGDLRREAEIGKIGEDGCLPWCNKGMAGRFSSEDGKRKTLVEYFLQASELANTDQIHSWVSLLENMAEEPSLRVILGRYPDMSEVASTFMIKIMLTNAKRILDGYRRTRVSY